MKEKRKNRPMSDQEMYKISDIDSFIKKEKRKDELDRLYEVTQQKKIWQQTVIAAAFLVLIFLTCAIYGATN